jgi:hypothetical protein
MSADPKPIGQYDDPALPSAATQHLANAYYRRRGEFVRGRPPLPADLAAFLAESGLCVLVDPGHGWQRACADLRQLLRALQYGRPPRDRDHPNDSRLGEAKVALRGVGAPDENQLVDTVLATSRAYRTEVKARGEDRCRRHELLLMWRAASARAEEPVTGRAPDED